MNKNEFLKELGTHLVILADKEQQDILAEYSQHIDMKIKNGLSEKEAIRDFGEIHDLAAEILEAYHVNPGYQTASPEKDGQNERTAARAGRNLLPRTLSAGIKKAALSACHMISACFRKCGAAIKAFLRALASPWKKLQLWTAHRGAGTESFDSSGFGTAGFDSAGFGTDGFNAAGFGTAGFGSAGSGTDGFDSAGFGTAGYGTDGFDSADFGTAGTGVSPTGRATGGPDAASGMKRPHASRQVPRTSRALERPARPSVMSRAFHSIVTFLADTCSLLLRFLSWCIRWCWNITMILLASFSGFLTLTILFFLGAAVVWLFQGYPLLGITLAGLGAILCGGSFTFFCVSLIRRRRGQDSASLQKADTEAQKRIRKETQAEAKEGTQTGARKGIQTGIREGTQTEAQKGTQTEIREGTQTGIQEGAQTEVREGTLTGAREKTPIEAPLENHTDEQEKAQTEAREEAQMETREEVQHA